MTNNPGWECISPDAQDLIKKMVCPRSKRWSAQQIMEHKWVVSATKGKKGVLNAIGIKDFYETGNLKRVAMTTIAFQLSEKQIQDLAKIFTEIDTNGDGELSYEELLAGFAKLGMNIKEVEAIYKNEFDRKNRRIKYNEFIASTMEKKVIFKEELALKNAFCLLDKDSNGKITPDELMETLGTNPLFKNKPKSYWEDMIKEADSDGDGTVRVRINNRSIIRSL